MRVAPRKRKRLITILVGAACVLLIGLALLLSGESEPGFAEIICDVDYPETVQYPHREDFLDETGQLDQAAYWTQMEAFYKECGWESRHTIDDLDTLEPFFSQCAQEFLSDSDDKNRVFSPLSLYFALDVLAEATDGASRQQILKLLGSNDLDALREQAALIWENNYRNNGLSSVLLANALWLSDAVAFDDQTLARIAENCHASSYRVRMGSDAANAAYCDWLRERTNGLLSEQRSYQKLPDHSCFALTSTLYFFSNWAEAFEEANTAPGVFHAAKRDVSCDFMNQRLCGGCYYWGERFTAIRQNLNDDHCVLYVLPEEGVSPDELLSDAEYLRFVGEYLQWKNQKNTMINLSVPKFDLSSELELTQGLRRMGITDVFDKRKADFSPLTNTSAAVTAFKQSVRLTVDETGCTAGAVTVIAAGGGGPREEMDFALNRSFLFLVCNADALPLFVGVVNQPE